MPRIQTRVLFFKYFFTTSGSNLYGAFKIMVICDNKKLMATDSQHSFSMYCIVTHTFFQLHICLYLRHLFFLFRFLSTAQNNLSYQHVIYFFSIKSKDPEYYNFRDI